MKYYVVLDNSDNTKYAIIGSSKPPKGVICDAPKDSNGEYIRNASIIRVDDIQPTTERSKQAIDANGDPIFETLQTPTYDLNGDPILDANSDPVMRDYQSPVYEVDANGDTILETVPDGDTYKQAFEDSALVDIRDTNLIQDSRDEKLNIVRILREEKFKELDLMVTDLVLKVRIDVVAIKTYQDQLKDITDTYKDPQDINKGMSTLDSIDKDMSNFVWPTVP